ncbi:hypothetical protein CDD83_7937 [Cordyceps sp. RAO-2017]|nr:hypothetical protein CDD83_7937 [Cordyceps sp. RAO-2017]
MEKGSGDKDAHGERPRGVKDESVPQASSRKQGAATAASSDASRPSLSTAAHHERVSSAEASLASHDASGAGATGRSVKSIVAWMESPQQGQQGTEASESASSKSAAKPEARKYPSAGSAAGTATSSATGNIPKSPDVEDYSLTLLKYKEFFNDKPLGRRLDGETRDLSKIPLEQIFAEAEKRTASEKTTVSIDRSAHESARSSSSVSGPRPALAGAYGSNKAAVQGASVRESGDDASDGRLPLKTSPAAAAAAELGAAKGTKAADSANDPAGGKVLGSTGAQTAGATGVIDTGAAAAGPVEPGPGTNQPVELRTRSPSGTEQPRRRVEGPAAPGRTQLFPIEEESSGISSSGDPKE